MSVRPSRRRMLASILGVTTLLASVLPVTAAQPPDLTATPLTPSGRVSAFKSASADLAKSDPALLRRHPRRPGDDPAAAGLVDGTNHRALFHFVR